MPLRAGDGTLHSLQFIGRDGSKRFLRGGRVAGLHHLLGAISENEAALCVAEGYATAASIHEATGYPVAVAFNAGNLDAVTRALRQAHPHERLITCVDDDFETPGNPGLTLASTAARERGALIAVRTFGAGRATGETDFNDLHRTQGLDAVRAALNATALPADEDLDRAFALRDPVRCRAARASSRAFRPAPVAMPAVERFGEQICALLDTTPAIDEREGPVRTVLDLSPTARTKSNEVHDATERALGTGGTLYSVRDVAAKAAENVARLAALFHVLQHGISGATGDRDIAAAARIVRWQRCMSEAARARN